MSRQIAFYPQFSKPGRYSFVKLWMEDKVFTEEFEKSIEGKTFPVKDFETNEEVFTTDAYGDPLTATTAWFVQQFIKQYKGYNLNWRGKAVIAYLMEMPRDQDIYLFYN